MADSSVICVTVRVNGHRITVPCGNGSQDIKWLSSVVAKRYELMNRGVRGGGGFSFLKPVAVKRKPLSAIEADIVGPGLTIREMVEELKEQARVEREERQRAREQWRTENARRLHAGQPPLPEPSELTEGERKDAAWHSTPPGRGLRADARASDGGGAIPDVSVDTAPFCFDVELATEHRLGPDGGVEQTLWSALAHNHSEPGYRKALALREQYRKELVARADAIRREEEARFAAQLAEMGELLDVDMDDPKAVKRSLDADWQHVRIETVADGPEDVRATKLLLLKSFPILNDLYRHFSGHWSHGDSSSMQLQEFEHFLANTGAIDIIQDQKHVGAIFQRVNAGRAGHAEALGEDSMSRFEFFESLLHIAKHRLTDRRHGTSPSSAACVESLITDCLRPCWERLGAGPVRVELKSAVVRRWLVRHHGAMRRVFEFYCKQGSRTAASAEQASVLMDEEEFLLTLEHAGFMPPPGEASGVVGGARKGVVTRTSAREAFAGVQRDDDGTGIVMPLPSSSSSSSSSGAAGLGLMGGLSHAEQLSFNEFIEAVARVGLQKWPTRSVDLSKKIIWAFGIITDLDEHLGEPASKPVQVPASGDEVLLSLPGAGGSGLSGVGGISGSAAGLAEDGIGSVEAVTAALVPRATPRSTATSRSNRSLPVVEPINEEGTAAQ